MNVLLDYIASMIIFGILTLTIARIQTNINTTLYLNTQSIITQGYATSLAKQIEWDFLKIGHRTSGQKIYYADSTRLVFKGDLENRFVQDSVTYAVGTTENATHTFNPRDFPLYRYEGGSLNVQNFGLIEFKMTYIDSAYKLIPMPITTTDQCVLIRGINLYFKVESSEPTITPNDTLWASISWQKLMFPRNLNNLYY
ncbi:MAG: hypothetical protein HY562_00630 [Ignavibacteriales bacterium]|nr:hypothetical protein [Ignavibacteriales bacterium]